MLRSLVGSEMCIRDSLNSPDYVVAAAQQDSFYRALLGNNVAPMSVSLCLQTLSHNVLQLCVPDAYVKPWVQGLSLIHI